MEAWYAIAKSDGKAKAVFLWDTNFVHLQNALERMEAIFDACAECKILQVYSRTLETATNPAAMQQLANSILQHYGGEVEYIFTPYGFGVAPVQAAVAASGEEVEVLSKNAEQQNLEMVAAGEQGADFGSSVKWSGLGQHRPDAATAGRRRSAERLRRGAQHAHLHPGKHPSERHRQLEQTGRLRSRIRKNLGSQVSLGSPKRR